jgi:hypothetical protein
MKTCTPAAVVRIGIGIALTALVGGYLMVPGLLCRPRTTSPLPAPLPVFESETGITAGSNWRALESGVRQNGMSEGEAWVVLQLPEDEIKRLLESAPPWSTKWRSGPVPGQIGLNCRFGGEQVSYSPASDRVHQYAGNPEVVAVLGSPKISYDAQSRDSLMTWERGCLLIVDHENRKVWLSMWNY